MILKYCCAYVQTVAGAKKTIQCVATVVYALKKKKKMHVHAIKVK